MTTTTNAHVGRLVCSAVKLVSLAVLVLMAGTYASAGGAGGEQEGSTIVVDTNAVFPPPGMSGSPKTCVTTPFLAAYKSIQAAVNAASAGALILVCPGNYPELVSINKSLTLRGTIDLAGNAGAPVITLPNGGSGVVANYSNFSLATGSGFAPAVAQVLIQAANVHIANLAVDASNTYTTCSVPSLIGILYTTGSSGSVNRAAVRNQSSQAGGLYCSTGPAPTPVGIGILADNPGAVSILNSSIRGFDYAGIAWGGTLGHVTVDNDTVIGIAQGATCSNILLEGVGGGQVSNNTVASCSEFGIYVIFATQAVAISGNDVSTTLAQGGFALDIYLELNRAAVTISHNKIAGGALGVGVNALSGVQTSPGATIQDNHISGVETGIVDLAGGGTISGNTISGVYIGIFAQGDVVSGNTINDATVAGVCCVAAGNTVSGNTYLNVTTLAE
jgi:hypothetical protein